MTDSQTGTQAGMTRYPTFTKRVKATLVDVVVILAVFIITAMILSHMTLPGQYKAAVFAIIIFMLEPALVSFTGGTIGHHAYGIGVRHKNSGKNLNLFMATLRFVLKTLMGSISLVFILVTNRHQALHDMASGSVVVLKNPQYGDDTDGLVERSVTDAGYIYPHMMRRLAAAFVYGILLLVFSMLLALVFVSDNCLIYNRCSAYENLFSTIVGFAQVLGLLAIFVLALRGRLYGARRTHVSASDNPHNNI